MSLHMQPAQTARKPCHHYIAGNCRFGDHCKFQHDVEPLAVSALASIYTFINELRQRTSAQRNDAPFTLDLGPSGDTLQTSTSMVLEAGKGKKPRMKRGEVPCHAWKAGSCVKGAKCFFAHDPEVRSHQILVLMAALSFSNAGPGCRISPPRSSRSRGA